MPGRKRTRTAGELVAELETDPDYLERRRQRDAEHARAVERYLSDVRPVIADLRAAGFSIDSIDDLQRLGTDGRNRRVSSAEYDRALPILMEHLKRPYSDHVAEVLANAVAVPGAQPYWQSLKSLYVAESRRSAKEQLAYALAVSANDQDIEELIDLVRERSNGKSRLYLLLAFDRRTTGYRASRQAQFAAVVDELRLDPALQPAINSLRWAPQTRQRASPD